MFCKNYIILFLFTNNMYGEIFSITIPKSGSHLINKCISLITNKIETPLENFKTYKKQPKNCFFWNHSKHDNEISKFLNKETKFLMVRDPRDQIISMIFWITHEVKAHYQFFSDIHKGKKKGTDFLAYYNLSFDEKILELINDGHLIYDRVGFSYKPVKNIKEFYQSYLEWLKDNNICLVKFENLIGKNGEGSQIIQLKEISRIAKHLKIKLSPKQIVHISKKLFGGTHTFRKGKIGSWKKYFKPVHKTAFKKVAGQLLIDLGYEKDFNW